MSLYVAFSGLTLLILIIGLALYSGANFSSVWSLYVILWIAFAGLYSTSLLHVFVFQPPSMEANIAPLKNVEQANDLEMTDKIELS